MNTAQAMSPDYRQELHGHLMRLMFDDGFFVNEALTHVEDYCRAIFGNVSSTGCMIVRRELRRIEQEALMR